MTNALRHAGARRCDVTLRYERDLHITVADDGRGLDEGWSPGVGIRSMRDRATELGGTCRVTSAAGEGTLIEGRLPVGEGG
jgi:signal transduction histidine kinase